MNAETMTNIQQKRDNTVAIARGIAIIAMVVGHCVAEGDLKTFIYKWHMPLFFFFSGYFFVNGKYSFKNFTLRKLRTIYVPFAFWGVLLIWIHNPLVDWNIVAPPHYNLTDQLKFSAICIFRMNHIETFLGTFWFLKTFLLVNICAFVIAAVAFRVLRKLPAVAIYSLLMAVAFALSLFLFADKSPNEKNLVGLAFFFAGSLARNYSIKGGGFCCSRQPLHCYVPTSSMR